MRAREGADVALLARGETGLLRVAARVQEAGRQALILQADVADRVALEASIAEAVRQFGGLDVVVSAAGASGTRSSRRSTPSRCDRPRDHRALANGA